MIQYKNRDGAIYLSITHFAKHPEDVTQVFVALSSKASWGVSQKSHPESLRKRKKHPGWHPSWCPVVSPARRPQTHPEGVANFAERCGKQRKGFLVRVQADRNLWPVVTYPALLCYQTLLGLALCGWINMSLWNLLHNTHPHPHIHTPNKDRRFDDWVQTAC